MNQIKEKHTPSAAYTASTSCNWMNQTRRTPTAVPNITLCTITKTRKTTIVKAEWSKNQRKMDTNWKHNTTQKNSGCHLQIFPKPGLDQDYFKYMAQVTIVVLKHFHWHFKVLSFCSLPTHSLKPNKVTNTKHSERKKMWTLQKITT